VSDSQRLLEQANAQLQAGQSEAAEWLYRAVLALDADNAEATHHLGQIEYDSGQTEPGLAHLQQAVALAPAVGAYRLALATALLELQRPLEAQEVLAAAPTPLETPAALELRQQLAQILDPNQTLTLETPAALNGSAPPAAAEMVVITLADALRVCAPADIHALATYVLLEQGDWHEKDALALLRRFIQPGMIAVDGGAQHGVYTLTLAHRLQGAGTVIALEPTARAANLLTQSVAENDLAAVVTVLPLGLAVQSGAAELSVYADRKPNSLDGQRCTELVKYLTLDELIKDAHWPATSRVDFLRLNVGELLPSILFTGREFFAAHSPLLMLRVTGGSLIPTALIDAMAMLKMTLYQIVPGLNALLAINVAQPLDQHQRNLFACRAECAKQLHERGLLINTAEMK
jgi:FkbM family methyltransferase